MKKSIYEKIKNIFIKYKEIILYIFFGGLTTVVNFLFYFLCKNAFSISTSGSNIIAWFLSVVFAFFTNKYYVFSSSEKNAQSFIFQFLTFVSARVLSGAIDTAIVVIFIDKLHYNEFLIKLLSNIFVIVFNYVASKLVIFKKK